VRPFGALLAERNLVSVPARPGRHETDAVSAAVGRVAKSLDGYWRAALGPELPGEGDVGERVLGGRLGEGGRDFDEAVGFHALGRLRKGNLRGGVGAGPGHPGGQPHDQCTAEEEWDQVAHGVRTSECWGPALRRCRSSGSRVSAWTCLAVICWALPA